ncbi:hypothetical protein BT63DRAFT_408277 [Microthyrium microscopicum]|uniref:Uncharacterized protein n=1 Tax=Microthyrium microscopicum TaxID=703497 RepID=A0A6A6URL7_9PEZI|nr:hypothetical protein BT63DRAFT_408277 [Microthyrium microscopicum]
MECSPSIHWNGIAPESLGISTSLVADTVIILALLLSVGRLGANELVAGIVLEVVELETGIELVVTTAIDEVVEVNGLTVEEADELSVAEADEMSVVEEVEAMSVEEEDAGSLAEDDDTKKVVGVTDKLAEDEETAAGVQDDTIAPVQPSNWRSGPLSGVHDPSRTGHIKALAEALGAEDVAEDTVDDVSELEIEELDISDELEELIVDDDRSLLLSEDTVEIVEEVKLVEEDDEVGKSPGQVRS